MIAAPADPFDVLQWVDSYSRLPTLIDLYFRRPDMRARWFVEMGREWSCCDNVSAHKADLTAILAAATPAERATMMDARERDRLATLPRTITVYRGAYSINRTGLSWSLSRDVAARFPFLLRYRAPAGFQPLLLTGRVRRDRAVLKLDRSEEEIIASRVRIVRTEELEIPATAG